MQRHATCEHGFTDIRIFYDSMHGADAKFDKTLIQFSNKIKYNYVSVSYDKSPVFEGLKGGSKT